MNQAPQKVVAMQNKAINTALEILQQCGCKFNVVTPQGQTHTNFKKQVKRPKVFSFIHFNIAERFASAIPGAEIVFNAGNIPVKNLRARLTGEATRVFGPGNYTTVSDSVKKTVTVVAGTPTKQIATEINKSIRSLNQSHGKTEVRLYS